MFKQNRVCFSRVAFIVACFVSAANGNAAEQQYIKSMSELTWHYRVILAKGSSVDLGLLKSNRIEIDDRDIAWFFYDNGNVYSNKAITLSPELIVEIHRQYFGGLEKVILLGKDGGKKAGQQKLELNSLFSLIDTMPMRQREMLH